MEHYVRRNRTFSSRFHSRPAFFFFTVRTAAHTGLFHIYIRVFHGRVDPGL